MFGKISWLTLAFFVAQLSFAQNTKTNNDEPVNGDMHKFMNDGKIGNVKNLVRIRANRTVAGYFGISYERKFTRKFGLEIGAYTKPLTSFVWNDAARQLFANRSGEFYPGATKGGICYMAYPKLYLSGKSLNTGRFIGLRNYYSTYSATVHATHLGEQADAPAESISSFLMLGSHRHIGSRIVLGFEIGGGYFQDTYKNVTLADYDLSKNLVVNAYKKDVVISGINVSVDIIFGILF